MAFSPATSRIQRHRADQRRGRAEHAVPADHGDLRDVAMNEPDHQGDDPAVREVGVLQRLAGRRENCRVVKLDVMRCGLTSS